MSTFVHCNRCFSSSTSIRYAVGSCFHITCAKCAPKGNNVCPSCKKAVKFVPIDHCMNAELKKYFMDPAKVLEEEMTQLAKRIEFQENLSKHLLEHLLKEKERRRQVMENIITKDKELEKELVRKQEWIEMAEKKLEQYNREKDELSRHCEELKSEIDKLSFRQPTTSLPQSQFSSSFHFADSDCNLSSIGGSSHSSFNMMSPLVTSPVASNETLFGDGFEVRQKSTEKHFPFSNQHEFKTPKATRHGSDTSTFSEAFNTIFTPSRDDGNASRTPSPIHSFANKTSLSDTTRYDHMNIQSRDSSLPSGIPLLAKHSRREEDEDKYRSNRELRFDSSVRELRRSSSKQGVVTRRSIIPSSYLDLD